MIWIQDVYIIKINLVRNFEDIHFFTKSVIYFEDGEIDVHIVRNRWGNVETIKANEI